MNHLVKPDHFDQQVGLNGFFSWLGKAFKAAVNVLTQVAIPGNGYGWWDAVIDFSDGDGSFGGQLFRGSNNGPLDISSYSDLPLTTADESNLDNWLNFQFLPYYHNLMSQIKSFSMSHPTPISLVQLTNEVYLFVSFIEKYKTYAIKNGESGFTMNAIKTRIAFLEVQVEILKEQMENYLKLADIDLDYKNYSMTVNNSKFNAINLNVPQTFFLRAKEVSLFNNEQVEYIEINDPNIPLEIAPTTNEQKGMKNGTKALLLLASGYVINKVLK